MYLENLKLLNFRNIEQAKIDFNKDINILYGKNAAGKTSVLEAIYFSATSRSPRTSLDKEMIKFGEKEAHIRANVKNDSMTTKIDVHIRKDDRKGIAVNGVPVKKLHELYGNLYVVIFSPEDLRMLKLSPSERRRFVDMELCQLSNVYYYNLQMYYRVLKERNNLLKKIQRDKKQSETIFVWDEQLIEYGTKIIQKRREYIEILSNIASDKHKIITDNKEQLNIIYQADTDESNLRNKLKRNIDRDIIFGSTSCGPHRDDLLFEINNESVKIFSSQGQQRTTALSLKLSEIDIIRKEKMTEPVLLLDDVLSELDSDRQKCLLKNIENVQIIITCTGIDHILNDYKEQGKIFYVENGQIDKIEKNISK